MHFRLYFYCVQSTDTVSFTVRAQFSSASVFFHVIVAVVTLLDQKYNQRNK